MLPIGLIDVKKFAESIQELVRTEVTAALCVLQKELPTPDAKNNSTISEQEAVNSDKKFVSLQSVSSMHIMSMSFKDAKHIFEQEYPSLFAKKDQGSWKVNTCSKELQLSSKRKVSA